jgi:hypothetical protein
LLYKHINIVKQPDKLGPPNPTPNPTKNPFFSYSRQMFFSVTISRTSVPTREKTHTSKVVRSIAKKRGI